MKHGQKVIGYRTSESSDGDYRRYEVEMREFVVCDAGTDVARDPSDYHVERLRKILESTGEARYLDEMGMARHVDISWQGNKENGVASGEFYAPQVECPLDGVALLTRVLRGLKSASFDVTPQEFIEHIEGKGGIPVRYLSDLYCTWVLDHGEKVTA